MPKPITSLTGFVRKISSIKSEKKDRQLLYRGHSKRSYNLIPSVFRTENLRKHEHLMLRQIIAEHPIEFINDRATFDMLVRAQHYGLPTRLLDVSINPLVALYFACCSDDQENGRVIIVIPGIEKQKYFDSDVVSLLSNLAFLTRSEKESILKIAKGTEDLSNVDRVDKFCKDPSVDKLIQTVKMEKPYFRSEANSYDLAYVVSVTPRKTHARIKAQDGAFLLFGIVEKDKGVHLEFIETEMIDISSTFKPRILDELETIGVSAKTLFPEIEHTADHIRKKYS